MAQTMLQHHDMILSRATPSDDKTSAPRMVTDAHVAVAERAYMDAFNTRQNRMRAALESFATSLPAARVPDGFIELLARAEDVANVDWTHMESGSWQKMRGLRTAIGMAKMSMFDAAPQAGEME